MSAPRRSSSCTCMKRFSKIVSVTCAVPSAMQFERHELRLHVGRESRVRRGAEAHRLRPPGASHADRSRRPASMLAPASRSLSITASRWSARASLQQHVAAGRRHGAQEGAGLDAVGHDAVRGAVQALDALDADAARCRGPRSCAPMAISSSARSATSGSLRGVLEHRLALGQRGGHHQVLGAGDGDHVGGDARALQPLRPWR